MAPANKKRIESELRKIPGVDRLLEFPQIKELSDKWSQPLIVSFIRAELTEIRSSIRNGEKYTGDASLIISISGAIENYTTGLLKEVINATGIIIHTNLGRSPLSKDILDYILQIASGYSNLEFDLITGKRGKRGQALSHLLSTAIGCEAGLVVNNNAAALFLALSEIGFGKEVLISRGELVQIGGGFKIPEIMAQSGAIMKEVGTTNRTSLNDYKKAVTKNTAMILKVHSSNFIIDGFTESAGFGELVSFAKKKRIPVLIDLGSGVLLKPSESGLVNEPTVHDALRSRADLICFSGDKLLGGGQAGIIVGKRRLINRLRKNPIYRIIRPDKITIGIIEKLFIKYLKGDIDGIPIWSEITFNIDMLKRRSERFIRKLGLPEGTVSIKEGNAYAGGGSDPGGKIKSIVIVFNKMTPASIAEKLRKCEPPVIGRIDGGKFCIDLRTVLPHQEKQLVSLITKSINNLQ
ncbi:MAG: L-seryl-tRNA(Sec) selenium transferase [candidate division Zixibacteria bacterium]|nr:L-seryl-tRNA(Sec) selenium transferase [candidate division Zixibacteria bacterium]